MHYHWAKKLLLICLNAAAECLRRVCLKYVEMTNYIVTFYGQVSASAEVLMINPKLCFALLSMTSWFCCSEGKVHPVTGNEGTEGEYRYNCNLSLSSALDGGGWLTPCPSCFAPISHLVPLVQEVGWDPGPVWTGAENCIRTKMWSLDCQACGQL